MSIPIYEFLQRYLILEYDLNLESNPLKERSRMISSAVLLPVFPFVLPFRFHNVTFEPDFLSITHESKFVKAAWLTLYSYIWAMT